MNSRSLDRFISRFLFAVFVSFSVFATTLGLLVATSSASLAAKGVGGYNRAEIKRMVVAEATRNGVVPPALALAVAKVESDFQADVESSAGARGVMQIMPATARSEFGVPARKLWNPRQNIYIGVTFLERLYRQYGNRWDLALSHYNGGTLKGGKGAKARPHSYTRKYVADVKRHWRNFDRARVVLAAKQTQREFEVSKQQIAQSGHTASAYWLLEEQGVEKDWRDYLKEADRILEGADLVADAADQMDVVERDHLVPDWYEEMYLTGEEKRLLRQKFRKSLRQKKYEFNKPRRRGSARFM